MMVAAVRNINISYRDFIVGIGQNVFPMGGGIHPLADGFFRGSGTRLQIFSDGFIASIFHHRFKAGAIGTFVGVIFRGFMDADECCLREVEGGLQGRQPRFLSLLIGEPDDVAGKGAPVKGSVVNSISLYMEEIVFGRQCLSVLVKNDADGHIARLDEMDVEVAIFFLDYFGDFFIADGIGRGLFQYRQ